MEEQLLTVLRMVDAISEKQNEKEVVAAMKRGKDALQILHDEMGVDDVLNLMDEIRDQDEVEKRINEVLGEVGISVVEGAEENLLAELQKLEEEVQLEAKGVQEEDVSLPNVPTSPLPVLEEPKKADSEKEKVAVAS